jgi:hypothetical protein
MEGGNFCFVVVAIYITPYVGMKGNIFIVFTIFLYFCTLKNIIKIWQKKRNLFRLSGRTRT